METAIAHELEHANINGRNVWHYMIHSDIGDIHIVQHEAEGREILYDHMGFYTNHEAEKIFKRVVTAIVKGRK